MKKHIFIFFFLTIGFVYGQDFQYTQFYASQLYLNPAFTGAVEDSRAVAHSRYQWVRVSKFYENYTFAVDHNFHKSNSGIGLIATHERAGIGHLNNTSLGLLYSYTAKLNKNWNLRSGVQLGGGSRRIDFSRLTFGDQITQFDISESSEDLSEIGSNLYFDIGSGFLFHTKRFWIGIAGFHLNYPNYGLTGTAKETILPAKYIVHTGYRMNLIPAAYRKKYGNERIKDFIPSLLYKAQGESDQLDIGAYFHLEPFTMGLWYRGLVVLKAYEENLFNQDAMAISLGYQTKYWNFGYSYDFTISQLGNTASSGSHEISVGMLFYTTPSHKKKKKVTEREMISPCPDF